MNTLRVWNFCLKMLNEKTLFSEQEDWRKKGRSLVPANGIIVKHIKTGKDSVDEYDRF